MPCPITKSKDSKVFLKSRRYQSTLANHLAQEDITSLDLVDAKGFPSVGGWIRIGSEVLFYGQKIGNSLLELQRDVDVDSHVAGSVVELLFLNPADASDAFKRIRKLQDEVEGCLTYVESLIPLPSEIGGGGGDTYVVYGNRGYHFEEVFTAATTYDVVHNLDAYPQVHVFLSTGVRAIPRVTYIDTTTVRLTFTGTLTDAMVVCDTNLGAGHFQETFTATGSYVISHNLGAYPQFTLLNSSLQLIYASVTYTDINTITLAFSGTLTNAIAICDTSA